MICPASISSASGPTRPIGSVWLPSRLDGWTGARARRAPCDPGHRRPSRLVLRSSAGCAPPRRRSRTHASPAPRDRVRRGRADSRRRSSEHRARHHGGRHRLPSSTPLVRPLPERRPDSSAVAAIAGIAGVIVLAVLALVGVPQARRAARAVDPAIVTVHSVARPKGLMVTSGGWAYCEQVRALARRTGYTLLCGRYANDGYTGPGLRAERHLDWGNPAYLDSLAQKVRAAHRRVGGELVLIGVSYSGFGVATLASHHPELHPDRLIAIDTYLELVPRRAALPASHQTARDIDAETSGSRSELEARSVSAAGLARLVRTGTSLAVIWTISPEERREFNGATCDRRSNAGMLGKLAGELGRPVTGGSRPACTATTSGVTAPPSSRVIRRESSSHSHPAARFLQGRFAHERRRRRTAGAIARTMARTAVAARRRAPRRGGSPPARVWHRRRPRGLEPVRPP